MFQYGQRSNVLFEVEHQHSDGSWGRLAPEDAGQHHDPAGHDPEQQWQRGHVYVCLSCEERVRIKEPEEGAEPG
jgi:hypothetical protein